MTKDENIKLCIADKWVKFETVTWSGSDNQASREISFTLPSNPYDKNFEKTADRVADVFLKRSTSYRRIESGVYFD